MADRESLAPAADEDLMRLFKAGRMDALEAIYDRHSPGLMGYIYRMVGRAEVAQDLLHDLVLAVARGVSTYVYPRPVRPWLYTIARNLTINFINKKSATLFTNEQLDEHGDSYGWFTSPDDVSEANELKSIIRVAFEILQPAEKEIVFLRLTQGLRFADIAEVTGCTVATARQRMSRAIRKLRKSLPRK